MLIGSDDNDFLEQLYRFAPVLSANKKPLQAADDGDWNTDFHIIL